MSNTTANTKGTYLGRLLGDEPLPPNILIAALREIDVRDKLVARCVGASPRAVGHWGRGEAQPTLRNQELLEDLRLLSRFLLKKYAEYEGNEIVKASLLLRVGDVGPDLKLPPAQADLLAAGKLSEVLGNLDPRGNRSALGSGP